MGARFEAIKNHDMLIKSVSCMKTNQPFQVILAGDGPLYEQCLATSAANNLENKIKFIGFIDNLQMLIQVANAVILTSEKEGIPRIIMEAMAIGVPVIATDVPGTRELVENDLTGELVLLNDYLGLANKMDCWLKETYKSKLDKYKKASLIRIKKNFTEEIVAKRIHEFYQELITRKNI